MFSISSATLESAFSLLDNLASYDTCLSLLHCYRKEVLVEIKIQFRSWKET